MSPQEASDLIVEGNLDNQVNAAAVLDLRVEYKANKQGYTRFGLFFDACGEVLEDRSEGAQGRRHGEVTNVQGVASVSDLKQKGKEKLRGKIDANPSNLNPISDEDLEKQCCSESYLRLQLMPPNPFAKTAEKYFGRMPYRLTIGTRCIHGHHAHFDFCSVNTK
jgi:hypothetical protein